MSLPLLSRHDHFNHWGHWGPVVFTRSFSGGHLGNEESFFHGQFSHQVACPYSKSCPACIFNPNTCRRHVSKSSSGHACCQQYLQGVSEKFRDMCAQIMSLPTPNQGRPALSTRYVARHRLSFCLSASRTKGPLPKWRGFEVSDMVANEAKQWSIARHPYLTPASCHCH